MLEFQRGDEEMSRRLILDLSEEIYAALEHRAEVEGASPAEMAARSLERQYVGRLMEATPRSQEELEAARLRFESHFGEIDLGAPTGADNDGIDADLAREYSATHEAT